MWVDRTITLQSAYAISDNPEGHNNAAIFRALDRLYADRNLINEDSRAQRFEATQKLALELDRRNVPMRDPAIENAAVVALRETLGFSPCGTIDLHPTKPERPVYDGY